MAVKTRDGNLSSLATKQALLTFISTAVTFIHWKLLAQGSSKCWENGTEQDENSLFCGRWSGENLKKVSYYWLPCRINSSNVHVKLPVVLFSIRSLDGWHFYDTIPSKLAD